MDSDLLLQFNTMEEIIMTEKLVIKAQNSTQGGYNPIFVGADCHRKVKSLSISTGFSMRELTEKFISFAVENLDIEPAEDGVKPE